MSRPTKILQKDLDVTLQTLINQLKVIQGDAITLSEKLLNIDTSMMGNAEAEVISDLKQAYLDSGKPISQRVAELEDELETGNYSEVFTYENGNVIKHESSGDRVFTVTYNYKDDGSGELINSVKTFSNGNGKNVQVTKTYSYTNGDITGIQTETLISPEEPSE
ncbi:hypothetical protein [Virgibacillus salexigens]|uniref:Uncharacterized protein n=1 Tax=Virgibacillus massiliensis TaxID=1462526 RepID=A0A024QIL4_9BACI|nr:hypothetical protein [Virgibacillus massiliensis]CDQ41801.1 hypothetical protein BN990_04178 [Virgibacillus massiliensis]